MKNIITTARRKIGDILSIQTHNDFHHYLLCNAIDRYKRSRDNEGLGLGRVVALCSNQQEAMAFSKYDFEEILLTGINPPGDALLAAIDRDNRISYRRQNSECLDIGSGTFDLVICKEGIHHLARPVLGVYEMLRITKSHIVIIEPANTLVNVLLMRLGLASDYEKNLDCNINCRDNYVYRWSRDRLRDLLNSYYLESGYELHIISGWMSGKLTAHKSKAVRVLSAFLGAIASYIPGSPGNYMTAVIKSGANLPPDAYAQ